jgi:hypothetical protein
MLPFPVQISQIEESVAREEEEDRERLVAKEKWLKEREDKKRTLQVLENLTHILCIVIFPPNSIDPH